MRQYAFAALFAVAACATASAPDIEKPIAPPARSPLDLATSFQLALPEPQSLGPELNLWATHYHTPVFRPAPPEISAAMPLIGKDDLPISPMLTTKDWCAAALQGSLAIRSGGKTTNYVYIDDKGTEQANCDEWLGGVSDGVKRATRRARFKLVRSAQGCGLRQLPLLPFRTIAVDPDIIPVESVVYAPELRGCIFRYGGASYVHDGYLFAGDRGGAIHGKHVDIFTDGGEAHPFPGFIGSHKSKTFAAYIVEPDDPAVAALAANHDSVCRPDPA